MKFNESRGHFWASSLFSPRSLACAAEQSVFLLFAALGMTQTMESSDKAAACVISFISHSRSLPPSADALIRKNYCRSTARRQSHKSLLVRAPSSLIPPQRPSLRKDFIFWPFCIGIATDEFNKFSACVRSTLIREAGGGWTEFCFRRDAGSPKENPSLAARHGLMCLHTSIGSRFVRFIILNFNIVFYKSRPENTILKAVLVNHS